MGLELFKCKYCGKVYGSNSQSLKRGLCRECYMKLEDLYYSSGIHDYIRDNGLSRDFDPEELSREIKMNPTLIRILYDMGFFDRDIQVYSSDNKRIKKLAERFEDEIEKIKHHENNHYNDRNTEINHRSISKFISYGGSVYRRRSNF